MRYSLAVVFAASFVSGLTVLKRQTGLPACAQTCLTKTDPSPCNATDTACQCLNVNYITAITTCVASTCTDPNDAQTATTGALAICKSAGVDLTNPLPACASTCGNDVSTTGCTDTDGACLCKNTAYIQSVDSCFRGACTGTDLTNAEAVGEALCRAYGVDVSSTIGAA